jgi:anthranilate phosphoribosyltransferase
MVVHGGGLDEIALHAPTTAAWVEGGEVRQLELTPEGAGLARRPLADLRGGEPAENAAWLTDLLRGHGSPAHNDAVAINAGALLWVAHLVDNHRQGTEAALTILHEGKAHGRFLAWRHVLTEYSDV